jgi:hypothetical protein
MSALTKNTTLSQRATVPSVRLPTAIMNQPEPSSVDRLTHAFEKRSKALKHVFSVRTLQFISVEGRRDVGRQVDILLRRGRSLKSLTIELKFWEDRWVAVSVRRAIVGQPVSWRKEGRLSGDHDAAELIGALELTNAKLGADGDVLELDALWNGLLLAGLLGIVS